MQRKRRPVVLIVLACLVLWLAFFVMDAWVDRESGLPVGSQSDDTVGGAPELEGHIITPAAKAPSEASTEPAKEQAPAAWWITGRVSEPNGNGIADARVAIQVRRGSVLTHVGTVPTDDEGTYRADVSVLRSWPSLVRATGKLVARVRAPGFVPTQSKEVLLGSTAFDTPIVRDVEMERGSMVEGRVLTESGTPAQQASVLLLSAGTGTHRDYTSTDADGLYAIGVAADGTFRVEADTPADGWAQSETLSLMDRTTVNVPDLILRAGDAIEGQVVTGAGRALPDISVIGDLVKVARGGSMHLSATTDADGRFRMLVAKEGRYLVKIGEAFGKIEAECESGDRDVRLVVDDPMIIVRVTDADGRALPGSVLSAKGWRKKHADLLARVMAGTLSMSEARRETYASSAGDISRASAVDAFFVEPESAWHLAAYVEGAPPAEATVVLQPGQQIVEVALVIHEKRPTGRLALELIGSDGAPLHKFAVDVETLTGAHLALVRADEKGNLPPLPAGRVRLRIAPEAGASWLEKEYGLGTYQMPLERIVEIPMGATLRERVRVKQGGRFRLKLTYPDDKRPEKDDLHVTLQSLDDPDAPSRYAGMWVQGTGEDMVATSRFRTEGYRLNATLLEPAHYRMEVRTQAHGTHKQIVRIESGQTTDVTMDVRQ